MPFRRMITRVLLLLLMTAGMHGVAYGFSGEVAGDSEAPKASPSEVHKFHVSYGRMAIEDKTAMLQIRLFKDDLEIALQDKAANPDFTLGVDPLSDSLFTQYFNEVFILKQDEVAVPGYIVSSGEEQMAGEPMWWYMVRFDAPAPLNSFTVRDVVLFDHFDDQKNIFKVTHFPSEKELSYYFAKGAEEYTVVF